MPRGLPSPARHSECINRRHKSSATHRPRYHLNRASTIPSDRLARALSSASGTIRDKAFSDWAVSDNSQYRGHVTGAPCEGRIPKTAARRDCSIANANHDGICHWS